MILLALHHKSYNDMSRNADILCQMPTVTCIVTLLKKAITSYMLCTGIGTGLMIPGPWHIQDSEIGWRMDGQKANGQILLSFYLSIFFLSAFHTKIISSM